MRKTKMGTEIQFLNVAFARAREIAGQETRFRVCEDRIHKQGNKNRIVSGQFNGRPAALKYYDDRIRPGASRRKSIEVFFLRHAETSNVTPRLLGDFEDCILMDELEGIPLEEKIDQQSGGNSEWLRQVGTGMGAGHARLANLPLSEQRLAEYESAFEAGRDFASISKGFMEQATEICESVPALKGYGEKIDLARKYLPQALKEQRTLYKYDNNLGNVIVDENGFVGFIDFEECFVGTETMYLGAIFDCLHKIPWRASDLHVYECPTWESVKQGYEKETDSIIDDRRFAGVVAMSILNACRRIVDTFQRHRDMNFWAPRHRKRLDALWKAIDDKA